MAESNPATETVAEEVDSIVVDEPEVQELAEQTPPATETTPVVVEKAPETTRIRDFELRNVSIGNPFRQEALKVLNGALEENDSISRHKILSYCEHLRTAYTTADIDFIRQVFSDNALIIVGQIVQSASGDRVSNPRTSGLLDPAKVQYFVRTKQEYVEKLDKIFKSGKQIDIKFSDFKIMRHPTMDGIYGVTLRQNYQCGSYADDGYLFLLWDFRNRSMPLIHVRTWQPTLSINLGDDELIGIGDFNLE